MASLAEFSPSLMLARLLVVVAIDSLVSNAKLRLP